MSENSSELYSALIEAQKQIGVAGKNADNPFHKSKYADIEAVIDACKAQLAEHGLTIMQMSRFPDGVERLVTRIVHSSGQYIEDDGIPLLVAKQDMQAYGSASTYARRYGIMQMLAIPQGKIDDDGNLAGGYETDKKKTRRDDPPPPKNTRSDASDRAQAFADEKFAEASSLFDLEELNALRVNHQESWLNKLKNYPGIYADLVIKLDRLEAQMKMEKVA